MIGGIMGCIAFNMGTGITSILLYTFPFNAGWLRRLGVVVFISNVVLFILIAFASVVRVLRWKGIFLATLKNTSAGLFWGTLPMGFTTIVVCPGGLRHWRASLTEDV